jgi:hypothetical protein
MTGKFSLQGTSSLLFSEIGLVLGHLRDFKFKFTKSPTCVLHVHNRYYDKYRHTLVCNSRLSLDRLILRLNNSFLEIS